MSDGEDKMAGSFIGRLRVLMQDFTEKGFAQLVGLKRPTLRSYFGWQYAFIYSNYCYFDKN